MIVTAVIYDYGEHYFFACCSYQTEMIIGILPLCWQSSCFQERYIINLFCSPHLICWLTMLKDRLCLGEEATIINHRPSPLWSHSIDPGPGSPQHLFWSV